MAVLKTYSYNSQRTGGTVTPNSYFSPGEVSHTALAKDLTITDSDCGHQIQELSSTTLPYELQKLESHLTYTQTVKYPPPTWAPLGCTPQAVCQDFRNAFVRSPATIRIYS